MKHLTEIESYDNHLDKKWKRFKRYATKKVKDNNKPKKERQNSYKAVFVDHISYSILAELWDVKKPKKRHIKPVYFFEKPNKKFVRDGKREIRENKHNAIKRLCPFCGERNCSCHDTSPFKNPMLEAEFKERLIKAFNRRYFEGLSLPSILNAR